MNRREMAFDLLVIIAFAGLIFVTLALATGCTAENGAFGDADPAITDPVHAGDVARLVVDDAGGDPVDLLVAAPDLVSPPDLTSLPDLVSNPDLVVSPDLTKACAGYVSPQLGGCWYLGAFGESCFAVCLKRGGCDTVTAKHEGLIVLPHLGVNAPHGGPLYVHEAVYKGQLRAATGGTPDPFIAAPELRFACACQR